MIEIKNLTFSYHPVNAGKNSKGHEEFNDSAPILNDVSLSVEEGQIAALVGPSGGGKSTIIKLLMGLYPVGDNRITVMGKSINLYPLSELRDLMAYVPQDAYLFDGTIEENIRFGKSGATQNDVIAAAKAANAHGFISEQADGYNTHVGERGSRLSGGQRQRIAIARALLKDAPILLLDEATSALDSESEQQVQEALNILMEGRTTIAVAHRLSTIESANVIYVIEKGHIVEQGAHSDLISKEGLYKSLYALQFSKGAA